MHPKKINQFDLDGKFIKEWNSIAEAAKSMNTTVTNISLNVNNKNASACNYFWQKSELGKEYKGKYKRRYRNIQSNYILDSNNYEGDDSNDEKNAFVYFHFTLNTNDVFYVGMGKNKNREISKCRGRNYDWYKLVKKNGFYAKKIHEGLTWKQALRAERYWISIFGRKDLGKGNLVNLTDGGEGTSGAKITAEQRKRLSDIQKKLNSSPEARERNRIRVMPSRKNPDFIEKSRIRQTLFMKNEDARKNQSFKLKEYYKKGENRKRISDLIIKAMAREDVKEKIKINAEKRKGVAVTKHSEEHKIYMSNLMLSKDLGFKVYQYKIDEDTPIKTFKSIRQAALELNIDAGDIAKCCKGNRLSCGLYKWQFAKDGEKFIIKKNDNSKIPITQILPDGTKKEWVSSVEAKKSIGANCSAIIACCKNKRKKHLGCEWVYTK